MTGTGPIRNAFIRAACRWALCLTACFSAALAISPAAADAFRGHAFGVPFGGPCTESPCGNGQFSKPSSVAVNDATGQIYVLDQGDGRIERFSSSGVYEAQFGGSETPAASFDFGSEPLTSGVVVDNSCYLRHLSGSACTAADPSNGDVYVTDDGHEVVDKFGPDGTFLNQLQEAKGGAAFHFSRTTVETYPLSDRPAGVAVNLSGTVFVYYEGPQPFAGNVAEFTNAALNGSGEANTFIGLHQMELTGEGGGVSPGIAVDSHEHLYAHRSLNGERIGKFDAAESLPGSVFPSLLNPFVPEKASAVAVDSGNDEVFIDNLDSIGAFDPEARLEERFGEGDLTEGQGIAVGPAPNRLYSTVYVADSAADRVAVFLPAPPGPPSVEIGASSVADVTADSAVLQAEINPHSEPGEEPTSYSFEYGPCEGGCAGSAYPFSTPAQSLPADFESHLVTAQVQGLSSGAAYHFRVVAHNSHAGVAEGEEVVFRTQTPGVFALPDHRVWEQVSPSNKLGAAIWPIGREEGVIQAAAGGDAVTYSTTTPTESDPQGFSNQVQVLSARGASGWGSRDIAIHHSQPVGLSIGAGQEYRAFSTDLSLALIQPFGSFEPSLSPEAGEQTPFLRSDFSPAGSASICAESCYSPLVTTTDATAGAPFGEEGKCSAEAKQRICGPTFFGATPDLSHIVLESKVGLTSASDDKGGLYEWSAAAPATEALQLVSRLPSGKPASLGVVGSVRLGREDKVTRGAISGAGSRVAFEATEDLYLRVDATQEPSAVEAGHCSEPGRACTIQLDAAETGCGACESGGGQFQLASTDGSRVFFADEHLLTADSGGAFHKSDLYECLIAEEAGRLKCALTDLTPETGGEPAAVQGLVPGASEDGEFVYFIAKGVLAANEVENGAGLEGAQPGRPNLYVYREGQGVSFLATLSAEDSPDWANGSNKLPDLTSRVSPDGRWLAFMSARPLTGYDNRDAVSGARDEEVFLYRAPSAGGDGSLICASCDPTGARPSGVEYSRGGKGVEAGLPLAGGDGVWPGSTWLAANIPGWTPYRDNSAVYQSRYLSDSGRLFFNSSDALAPQDTNGTGDVYQYEPPAGRGEEEPSNDTCSEQGPTYSPSAKGCVSLISSGTSTEESAFLDASESGNDVFFLTAAQLSPRDKDTALDVYDARVGGREPEPVKPLSCEGDACQSPIAAPEDATPNSLSFQGPGNLLQPVAAPVKGMAKPLTRAQKLARALRACARGPKRKRPACRRTAQRAYGSAGKKAKKSNGRGH